MAGTQRKISPEFRAPNCSNKKYISINCKFASAAEAEYTSKTYGISVCCAGDLNSTYFEYQMLKLEEIYDPEVCKPIDDNGCCLPSCAVSATLDIVNFCIESTNVDATLVLIP